MKSIFYRVWDNHNNKFFEPTYEALKGKLEDLHIGLKGDLFMRTMDGTIECEKVFPGRFVVEQSSSFLDKNRTRIHVGDLLSYMDSEITREVKFINGAFCAETPNVIRSLLDMETDFTSEIIGNIHQNPEPKEVTKKEDK